eukprot:362156-Chlamydomonas_euryale.AAC.17
MLVLSFKSADEVLKPYKTYLKGESILSLSAYLVQELVKDLVQQGRRGAAAIGLTGQDGIFVSAQQLGFSLMYSWHDSAYLGAIHGWSSMCMHEGKEQTYCISLHDDLKCTIRPNEVGITSHGNHAIAPARRAKQGSWKFDTLLALRPFV